jgi:methylthioribulose-1-phosphate dehydratase
MSIIFKKIRRDASFFLLTQSETLTLNKLSQLARFLDIHRAIPATSSNFSMRAQDNSFLISKSGLHKRDLNPSHFVRVDSDGKPLSFVSPKPSDETLLHALIYRKFSNAHVVAHSHACEFENFKWPRHTFCNHELLKTFGLKTHETSFSVPVFKNSQDMSSLSKEIESSLQQNSDQPIVCFVLENHGVYCFGRSVDQVQNYLEALFYLSKCHITMKA